jgi:predicted nucleic acid-binding protein
MPVAYFDTSALVKLVVDENGTSTAQQAWNEADAVVSGLLSYPEGRAALAAARRQRRLAPQPYRAALDRFENVWSSLEVIEIAPAIARFAGALAERLALRGYDGVHLATALTVSRSEGILVTCDRNLSLAALAEGLPVVPPGGRPSDRH